MPYKASGIGGISPRLPKEAVPIISSSLASIFNLSITKGIFSPMVGSKPKCPRYTRKAPRLIQIISPNFRTIETWKKKKMDPIIYDYLIANNILHKFQSGFRPLQSLYHHSHCTPRLSKELTSI